jgi:LPXTG-site transpeptidase (sortase) family protein
VAAFAVGVLVLAATAYVALNPPRRPDPAATARPLLPAPIITSGVFASPPPAASPATPEYRIRVPALQIDLPLVEGDGLNVPLYKAALYPDLKAPGEGGRSLIYAHGRSGMFGDLLRAQRGQQIIVESSDGRQLKYAVTQSFGRWPATDRSVLQPSDHEQLVLLTCTSYNPNDPRVVVFAEPA